MTAAVIASLGVVSAVVTPGSPVTADAVDIARVTKVVDGDTAQVRLGSSLVKVRFIGIDTMELGRCGSDKARRFVNRRIRFQDVRLSSNDPLAMSGERLLRHIDRSVDGKWVDMQLEVLQAGHALPLYFKDETDRWRPYMLAAQQARIEGRNLWNQSRCGAGPALGADLRLWVNYDGDGWDGDDTNSEWIRVFNAGKTEVDVSTWWIRSGSHDWFIFPSGSVIPPGEVATVYVGRGTRSGLDFYWGYSSPKFPNLVAKNPLGGGAYLFDPDGDVRASAMYPCMVNCGDPRIDRVRLDVTYHTPGLDPPNNPAGEYVVLRSVDGSTIDLSFTVLQYAGSTFEFPQGTTVSDGQPVTVRMNKGVDQPNEFFWGKDVSQLRNDGGQMVLRRPDAVVLACDSWGSGRC